MKLESIHFFLSKCKWKTTAEGGGAPRLLPTHELGGRFMGIYNFHNIVGHAHSFMKAVFA